ncbi:hypothetical protein EXIGLDRAFT_719073 [Exidia glandulosa HHB12029]|uniref:Uncharacterized protein n=1 Tax=Exidia glandulosa HHB12029 TaxID=1314781 RepID=A0A166AH07_EXIGL|nr:hypothetical protein EXIGLDRAFT_719073 [Exidia glandulosa HHB12029]
MSTDLNASFLLAAQQAHARSEEPGTPLPVIDEQVSEDLIKWVESLTPETIEELLKFASDATGVSFDPKDFAQLLPPVPEVCEGTYPSFILNTIAFR